MEDTCTATENRTQLVWCSYTFAIVYSSYISCLSILHPTLFSSQHNYVTKNTQKFSLYCLISHPTPCFRHQVAMMLLALALNIYGVQYMGWCFNWSLPHYIWGTQNHSGLPYQPNTAKFAALYLSPLNMYVIHVSQRVTKLSVLF